MANARITELAPITSAELQQTDLFVLADVSAHESKKLSIQEFENFLITDIDFFTGSFYGTASWATSASWVAIQDTASYAETSSVAYNAIDAISASYAKSASYSYSGSYVLTASYALTSSVILSYSSAYAQYSNTSSYLIYTPGTFNGTASFAVTSSNARTASFAVTSSNARTASYAINGGVINKGSYNITTSWASASKEATNATSSRTSSYLLYTGIPNGTASYALTSQTPPNVRINYGIFKKQVQSSTASIIDNIAFNSSIDGYYSSSICAVGSVVLPATSAGTINLIALDKWSGITQSLDSASISSTVTMGDLKIPFTLMGDGPMSSSQFVYVIATGGVTLDGRSVKFDVTSFANSVEISNSELRNFKTYPTAALMTYTSSAVLYGPEDYTAMMAHGANTITEINATNNGLTQLKYVYSLTNLLKLKCSNNTYLTDIGGMPNLLAELYCGACGLRRIAPLEYTALTIFDCSSNLLTSLPSLPSTLTYLKCNTNYLTSLPTLSNAITSLYADYNLLSTILTYPSSLITMSISNNLYLSSLGFVGFPSGLTYLNCNHTSLTNIPTLPAGMLYVNVSYCNMTQAALETICGTLVTSALNNGTLNISYNNGYNVTTAGYITTLQGRGWTVTS
jgi:hypothetical protein